MDPKFVVICLLFLIFPLLFCFLVAWAWPSLTFFCYF
jgi:hypothetical protein